MHKPKLMKLTPGVGAFYVISPGNREGLCACIGCKIKWLF